ncbi:MAG: 50S ribosomal protein L15 [Candidatus Eisenbacteria bacterium]|nr:50S ribosomal protein L15 [Candidatus Eisenbacteria bacterium]
MAFKLENLKPGPGAVRRRKRLGRGEASGTGKTSGRGAKGQWARNTVQPWFEGGQMPLQRRLPKRGFKNPFRKTYQIVNVGDLARCEGIEEITPEILAEKRIIRNPNAPLKLLGKGSVEIVVRVSVHAVSAAAREKVETAGGRVTLLE